ncbi:MAG: MlaD family protein [Arachidicoccus sp.]|nr:MlaD family protein [Arachidicoccus sp.]
MKISNETKIGALTIVAIVFLFLGFNFLKGKSLFKSGFYLYAKFPQAQGLVASNPVFINGYQAGSVSSVTADEDLKNILVEIKLNKAYQIPKGSVANISSNPLGSSSVSITLDSTHTVYLKSKDTLETSFSAGLFGQLSGQIKPLAEQANAVMKHLDTLMANVNNVLDSASRAHLREMTANLSAVTGGLVQTTAALNGALDLRNGALASPVKNFDRFTENLANNNANIDSIVMNLKSVTKGFSQLDLKGATARLQATVDSLNAMIVQAKSSNSSVGAIINNKEFYNNINTTLNSLHILLDDLRAHPKRYVGISIFGKKDKGNYLTQPLVSDSLPSSIQK